MKFRSSIVASVIGMIPLFISAQGNQTDTSSKLRAAIDTTVFTKVEIEASFPGGDIAWRKYLEKALPAFDPADHGAPISYYTVVVQFIVDKEGNITEVKPLTSYGYGMEEEVVRIIKKGPKWSPAILNGKPVKAYRNQPVTFVVEDEGIKITMDKKYGLYLDVDNVVSIKVDKVKNKDLQFKISNATITPINNDSYSIRIKDTGRVILEIYDRKKGGKFLGSVYFDVLPSSKH